MSSHRPEDIDPSVRITMRRDHNEPEMPTLIYDALAAERGSDPTAWLELDTEYWTNPWVRLTLPPGVEAATEQAQPYDDFPRMKDNWGESGFTQTGSTSDFVFSLDPAWFQDTLQLIMVHGPARQPGSPEQEKTQVLPVVEARASNSPTAPLPFTRRLKMEAMISPPPPLKDNRPTPEPTAIIEPPPLIPAGERDSPGGKT